MKLVLLLGMLAVAAPQVAATPAQDHPGARIEGVVRAIEDGVRTALPYALIEVVAPEGDRSVMADRGGAYRFEDVPAGRRLLRAIHVGYEPIELEVLVPASGRVEVDLVLKRRAVRLPPLRVVAEPAASIDVDPGDTPTLRGGRDMVGLRALEASPGLVESGLGEAVSGLPGNEPRDPSDVLLMRGSTADLKLVLLDGVPVYAPFHTGGLLRSFQMSTLGAASHHMGGAPARYDGGLSYILDLRTRAARRDRLRASGGLDLMSAKAAVEGPLGARGGVLAAGRALHDGGARLAGGAGSPYGYRDLLVRGDLDVGPGGSLAIMGFANHEAVHLDLPASGTRPGLDEASWGNRALSARWTGPVGRRTGLDIGVAGMSYRAELPVTLPSTGVGSGGSRLYVASGRTRRTRVTADLRLPHVAGGLRIGASLDRTDAAYGSRSADGAGSDARSHGSVLGAYVDGLYDLGPELDLRYGLRIDHFSPGGVGSAVRLAALWSLGSDALLTVAAGRYHQLLRPGDTEIDLGLGDGLLAGTVPETDFEQAGSATLLRPAVADHLTLSLDQIVTPEVRLAFEGYLKRFRNLGPRGAPRARELGGGPQGGPGGEDHDGLARLLPGLVLGTGLLARRLHRAPPPECRGRDPPPGTRRARPPGLVQRGASVDGGRPRRDGRPGPHQRRHRSRAHQRIAEQPGHTEDRRLPPHRRRDLRGVDEGAGQPNVAHPALPQGPERPGSPGRPLLLLRALAERQPAAPRGAVADPRGGPGVAILSRRSVSPDRPRPPTVSGAPGRAVR